MRRAPIVITATVLGTAGVLLFKPLPISALEGSTTSSGSTTAAGDSAGSASDAPTAAAVPTATPSSAPTATVADATVKGAVETDRYGETQVEVTIKGGKITEVTVLAYNDDEPRSAEISQQAIPILREEVLSTQTAAVDTVSGATYTSNAYAASLQSALDEAGYTAPDGSTATTDLATADANLRGH